MSLPILSSVSLPPPPPALPACPAHKHTHTHTGDSRESGSSICESICVGCGELQGRGSWPQGSISFGTDDWGIGNAILICLTLFLSVYLCVYVSIRLFAYLSIHVPILFCLFACLFVSLSLCLFVFFLLYYFVTSFTSLSVQCILLFIHLSVCICTYQLACLSTCLSCLLKHLTPSASLSVTYSLPPSTYL